MNQNPYEPTDAQTLERPDPFPSKSLGAILFSIVLMLTLTVLVLGVKGDGSAIVPLAFLLIAIPAFISVVVATGISLASAGRHWPKYFMHRCLRVSFIAFASLYFLISGLLIFVFAFTTRGP